MNRFPSPDERRLTSEQRALDLAARLATVLTAFKEIHMRRRSS